MKMNEQYFSIFFWLIGIWTKIMNKRTVRKEERINIIQCPARKIRKTSDINKESIYFLYNFFYILLQKSMLTLDQK